MVQEEERRREAIESMVMEMVTGPQEQVAPCIRNALERGWEPWLPANLVEFQEKRREEIERVCSRYYAEFLGSVQELLTAKKRSAALRRQILQFNDDIKESAQETLKTGHELQKQKASRKNIKDAIWVLAQCRDLTSLMVTAKQQIEDGRFYPALRTIESLKQQISNAYDQPFLTRVTQWLPELSKQVKNATLKEVSQWLVVIRSNTVAIGRAALRKCTNYMTGQGWEAPGGGTGDKAPVSPAHQILQQIESVMAYSSWIDEEEVIQFLPPFLRHVDNEEMQIFNTLSENLHPLHRALYVHARLGALDEVRQFYINNRLPQASIPTANASSADEFITQFQETLLYTAGFFVTEYTSLRATDYPEGLLTTAKLEEAWVVIQRSLCAQIEARVGELSSPVQFLQLKQTVLLVAYTLGEDCFRFNTNPLMDVIRRLKDNFQAAQFRYIQDTCLKILQDEVYQPIYIQSEKEYRSMIQPFGIDRPDDNASEPLLLEVLTPSSPGHSRRGGTSIRYPRALPFSAVVPRLCLELYRLVLLNFLYGLNLHMPAMEGVLIRATNDAMSTISRLLDKEIDSGLNEDNNFPISKACQISVDAMAMAKMTREFEKMLQIGAARFYSSEAASKVPEVIQNGKREFENASIHAQHLIFELIQRKIDELLGGMCFIEWETTSIKSKPAPYVDDVISYLQVTFMCLTYLPKMAREGIHFASCSHISNVMAMTLLDPKKVRAVNTNGLHNLSVDLSALESFADSCEVLQLRECFSELRQTLGVLLHRDIDAIMKDSGVRQRVYPKADVIKLISILEKYKPLGILATVKNQRNEGVGADLPYMDKKKVTEYIKLLRSQGI